MVFSSHHLYLDPPNWQYQQQQHQQQVILYEGGNEITTASSLQQQPLQHPSAAVGGSRAIRPGSMTDRARMAKVPLPETPLKCPRCESINTKFCYFNNYSLTQPRHFCKTCRRYWTRGGALRNVPVGGGCRKATKRSSKKRSKSSPAVSGSANAITTSSADQGLGNLSSADQMMPFYPHGTNQVGHGDHFGDHLYIGGGSYTGAPADPHLARLFQSGVMSLSGGGTDQQWGKVAEETSATATLTQMHPSFPFMANFSQQQEYSPLPLIHQFDHHRGGGHLGLITRSSDDNTHKSVMDSAVVTQFANVKMEDDNKGLRRSLELQAQAAAASNNNNQINWAGSGIGNTWTDLFGFPSNASSTGHNGL